MQTENQEYMKITWELIEEHLDIISSIIFTGYDKNLLTPIQKRFIIFNHLKNNYLYDHELYNRKITLKQGIHPWESMYKLITESKGLCSSMTPIYKFLLEREGIPSIGCYCNLEDLKNQHNILLVKNSDSWSFDDLSGAVIGEDPIENLFGYDVTDALQLKMPQKNIVGCSSSFLDNTYYKQLGTYSDEKRIEGEIWIQLPDNIVRIPRNTKEQLIANYSNVKKL